MLSGQYDGLILRDNLSQSNEIILTMCRIVTTIKQRLTCWRDNMDKKMPAILFEDPVKATQFALDYYGEYSQTLTKKEKLLIGTIQSSGLVIGDGRYASIQAIQKCFSTSPSNNVVWNFRTGRETFLDRLNAGISSIAYNKST